MDEYGLIVDLRTETIYENQDALRSVFSHMEGFLKFRGPPSSHFYIGIFHEINHPATGVPPFMETPI